MASTNETPASFKPLPGRTVDRSADYHALLLALLELVGAESPDVEEHDDHLLWRHRARWSIGEVVTRQAEHPTGARGMPDEWFEPLLRAAVYEPDPSFNRQLVEPAIAAFGRRRVQVALLDYLDTGAPADAAGAARAWYWTSVGVRYLPGTRTMTPKSAAEFEAVSDLRERYRYTALRRFLTDDDLDLRRCILPGLTLDPTMYPGKMRDPLDLGQPAQHTLHGAAAYAAGPAVKSAETGCQPIRQAWSSRSRNRSRKSPHQHPTLPRSGR